MRDQLNQARRRRLFPVSRQIVGKHLVALLGIGRGEFGHREFGEITRSSAMARIHGRIGGNGRPVEEAARVTPAPAFAGHDGLGRWVALDASNLCHRFRQRRSQSFRRMFAVQQCGSLAFGMRQRLNSEDQKLLDELNATTARLAKLELSGPGQTPPEEFRRQVSASEEQKERLETEISGRSAEFRAQTQPVTLAAVQAAIPRGAVLIEFAAFRPFNPQLDNLDAYGEPRYVAYVIRHQGEVKWKELGPAKEIESATEALRETLRDPERRDLQQRAHAVNEKIIQPLLPLFGDATQLLVSADGSLNLIPFAALVDEQGKYLIERYSIAYLTSGRDLLRLQLPRESKSPPVVIADPAFGEPVKIASNSGAGSKASGGPRRTTAARVITSSRAAGAPSLPWRSVTGAA